MSFCFLNLFVSLMVTLSVKEGTSDQAKTDVRFDDNYIVTYGNDHLLQLDQGREIQLSMDLATGAGFKSKRGYGSGYFQMRIKLPKNQSPGVVTTFYLTSHPDNQPGNHDELDFEFLGSDGPPFHLQTNVFANDNGGREQRIRLWFDPTIDFHQYSILWNSHQIVFLVDDIPIRVFKNYEEIGGRYPTQEQFIVGSIWNGEAWASGGLKVDWSKAPFQAHYRGFEVNGCDLGSGKSCSSQDLWWNTERNWSLTPEQQHAYEDVKKKFVYYDYCSNDRATAYTECQVH